MHAWEAIQKTLDHIEEHIREDIQIEALADIAALSLFYYQRLFTRLVKRPVREYIKLRRLARACSMLGDKNNRIIDVAMEYGFGSHEVFTRAFKDYYGITPAEYRNKAVRLDNFDKPNLLLNYVMVDEGVPLISEGLVLEMNRRLLEEPVDCIGLSGYMPFEPGKMLGERPGVNTADELWRRLFDSLSEMDSLPGGRYMGVIYKGRAPEGYTTFFAGVEVRAGKTDPRFQSWQLPSREYVVCGFEAESPEQLVDSALVGKAMKYTRFWLKNHGLRADGFFPELYYESPAIAAYMELWIPFRKREE